VPAPPSVLSRWPKEHRQGELWGCRPQAFSNHCPCQMLLLVLLLLLLVLLRFQRCPCCPEIQIPRSWSNLLILLLKNEDAVAVDYVRCAGLCPRVPTSQTVQRQAHRRHPRRMLHRRERIPESVVWPQGGGICESLADWTLSRYSLTVLSASLAATLPLSESLTAS
jgi:hypothetical protein